MLFFESVYTIHTKFHPGTPPVCDICEVKFLCFAFFWKCLYDPYQVAPRNTSGVWYLWRQVLLLLLLIYIIFSHQRHISYRFLSPVCWFATVSSLEVKQDIFKNGNEGTWQKHLEQCSQHKVVDLYTQVYPRDYCRWKNPLPWKSTHTRAHTHTHTHQQQMSTSNTNRNIQTVLLGNSLIQGLPTYTNTWKNHLKLCYTGRKSWRLTIACRKSRDSSYYQTSNYLLRDWRKHDMTPNDIANGLLCSALTLRSQIGAALQTYT